MISSLLFLYWHIRYFRSINYFQQKSSGSVKESLESKGELKRSNLLNKKKPYWRSDVTGKNAVKVTEDHVIFKSYRDGSKIVLSPESSIQAQKDIGADVS